MRTKTATRIDGLQPLPEKHATIAFERSFTATQMRKLRRGYIPDDVERWFIYWQDDRLHFHRSWTGDCIHVVHFTIEGKAGRAVKADVNRAPEQHTEANAEDDRARLGSLIDRLLLSPPPRTNLIVRRLPPTDQS